MNKPCPEGREVKCAQKPSNTSDWRPPKPGGSGPQSVIYATPDAMLEAVYKIGNHNYMAHICHFCEKPASRDEHEAYWENHERGCLYLQIEDYLKEIGRL